MSTPLPGIDQKHLVVLRVLDALLRLHGRTTRYRDCAYVDVVILGLPLHLLMCDNVMSEARIDLADDEAPALQALRWHLGPDTEISTMHRRVHRWLVDGREVLLDSFNGRRTCLRVA
jgi:hypothetical protein